MQIKALEPIFMGIDVSKQTLDISINGKHYKIKNEAISIEDFIKSSIEELGKIIRLCVLESTGGYEKLVMRTLQGVGIPVHRAHPNKVFAFAKASNHFAKTDKLDALLLEKYARFIADTHRGDEENSEVLVDLQSLRAVERQLEEELHAYQCRLEHAARRARAYIEQQIKFIKEQLGKIRAEIEEAIRADARLKEKSDLLTSYVGIGNKTASVLLIELSEMGRLSNKEIASLVGVAPKTFQSGKKVGKSSITGGRFYVRKALYMAALVAMRFNSKMQELYLRMIEKGKPAKVALTAIMRKIIICLNAMVKNNHTYQA